MEIKAPKYYGKDGTLTVFNKYYLDSSEHIVSKKTNKRLSYRQNKDGYYSCGLVNDIGKCRMIRIARMKASTFCGEPPSSEHTADHKNRVSSDDREENIKWATLPEQITNRVIPKTHKYSIIIVKDELEKTVKDWVEYLKDIKNSFGRTYTEGMISMYAIRKQHGFSYKKYDDLPGEKWLEISGSNNSQGHWEISNMNRVKNVTTHSDNVISGDQLGLLNGYPFISINKKNWLCHILSYKAFFPEEYANKKLNEMVLHEDDDRKDFRPHKLRLGNGSENSTDAYDNGKYDGTNVARVKCASYINGIFEKEHDSQGSAEKYLKSIGMTKACQSEISKALSSLKKGKVIKRYKRTWEFI